MRVGLVTKWLEEPNTGVGQYLRNLLQALGRSAPGLSLAFLHPSGREFPLPGLDGELRPFPRLGPAWLVSANCFAAIQADLDLVHEPYVGFPLPTLSPRVVTIHDLIPLLFPTQVHPQFAWYWRRLLPGVLAGAAAVIAVSRATADDLIRLLGVPEEKLRVVYEGIPQAVSSRQDAERVHRHAGPGVPFILAVGSIRPTKNLPFLVRAWSRARRRHGLAHHLVIAGTRDLDSPRFDRAVAASGQADAVHVTGPLPSGELRALEHAASVLAVPSIYEGFGFPALEAMVEGTPVVAARAGALPEVVGTGGTLVDVGDLDAWSDALVAAATDDGLRSRLITAGRERAARFSWEACAKGTLAVYREVAD